MPAAKRYGAAQLSPVTGKDVMTEFEERVLDYLRSLEFRLEEIEKRIIDFQTKAALREISLGAADSVIQHLKDQRRSR